MVTENKEILREGCLKLMLAVWKAVDWEKVSPSRRMKIYDEFLSKMVVSANASSINNFMENLCRKWGIRDIGNVKIVEIEKEFEDREFLDVIRHDSRILLLRLREKIEEDHEERRLIEEEKHQKKLGYIQMQQEFDLALKEVEEV